MVVIWADVAGLLVVRAIWVSSPIKVPLRAPGGWLDVYGVYAKLLVGLKWVLWDSMPVVLKSGSL